MNDDHGETQEKTKNFLGKEHCKMDVYDNLRSVQSPIKQDFVVTVTLTLIILPSFTPVLVLQKDDDDDNDNDDHAKIFAESLLT